jgi:poly(A) polymerase
VSAVPPNLKDAPWLTRGPLGRLLSVLDRDGEEARVVGGAVRDALLGHVPGDIDVATTATPDEVMRRAGTAGFKPVPTGIDHGTVTVVADGKPIEVTSLREDIETFGRKAVVRFGRDWKADAERRDFTINALSVGRDGNVVDHVGGLADLAARRVRFIGDAQQRIREDYLRILRFFRFHAAYGLGELDSQGLSAAIELRAGLDHLSRERVRMELMKLLRAPRAAPTLIVMADGGLIEPILGVPLVPQFARLAAAEAAVDLPSDPVRRLGALAVHVGEDAERLWQRLRLANTEHERLASMADGWWRVTPQMGEAAMRALLYRLGPERFCDRVLFAWSKATAAGDDAQWGTLATLPRRWQAPHFPLRAAAFIELGVPKGPQLGAALAGAEEAWIAAGFPDDPAALAALAAEWARRHAG